MLFFAQRPSVSIEESNRRKSLSLQNVCTWSILPQSETNWGSFRLGCINRRLFQQKCMPKSLYVSLASGFYSALAGMSKQHVNWTSTIIAMETRLSLLSGLNWLCEKELPQIRGKKKLPPRSIYRAEPFWSQVHRGYFPRWHNGDQIVQARTYY